MKKDNNILKLSIIAIVFLFNCLSVKAASNPYVKNSQWGINCTWYAWEQANKKAGVTLPAWGNANTWYDYAKKAGYEVGTTPRAKSIVVWKWSSYGHVGYVERVEGDKIYVWDSEGPCLDREDPDLKKCLENSPSESGDRDCVQKYGKDIACEYSSSYWNSPGDLIGYVYLDKIPTSNINQGTTVVKPKKSNNAFLKTLTIKDINFEFKKDTYKYVVEVDGSKDNVVIEAIAEHKASKVEGVGSYPLKLGLNTFNIVVIAEDNTKKTYTIEIKRKDNNANLNNLSITSLDFQFDKNTLEYEFNVNHDIDSIKIKGQPESDLATVFGLNDYNLQEGLNTITIKVVAEDMTEKIYTIKINRKEKENLKKVEESKEINDKNTFIRYIILGIFIIFLVIGILFSLIIKKYRKNK